MMTASTGTAQPYIALLRGVNVVGHRLVAMADLQKSLGSLGYRNVRTLLASGNVVFEGRSAETGTLEKKLENDLKQSLGLETAVMVRHPREWKAIIASNPFEKEAATDPSRFLVLVLKEKPPRAAIEATLARHKGPERVQVVGREAFIVYPNGVGKSKLNLKPLGTGTARNWNTVLKLRAMTV
jgi:uncharacterized protein (DUF1697 family)